ncbi:MAG: radical SAM protein, partial [Candidatus Bathyarchaeia archaeon]
DAGQESNGNRVSMSLGGPTMKAPYDPAPILDYAIPLRSIYLNVTNRCNLKCIHCAFESGAGAEELTCGELEQIVGEAVGLGLRYATIIGGEPFVRRDIFRIVEAFLHQRVRVGISTNGTLINEVMGRRLKQLPRQDVFLGVSLDGANAETHDSFRGVAGSFEAAVRGARIAQQAGFPLMIQSVLNRSNVEEIPAVLNLALRLNAWYRIVPSILPTGRGTAVAQKLNLGAVELARFLDKMFEIKRSLAPDQRFLIAIPPALTPPDLIDYGSLACDWGRGFCGILPNGDVALCHASDFCGGFSTNVPSLIAGNIRKERFTRIWRHSDLFSRLRQIDADDLKGVCALCAVRDWCRGYCRIRAFVEYGDLKAPDPICQRAYEEEVFPDYSLE